MKKKLTKILFSIVAVCTLILPIIAVPAFAAEIEPRYNNTISASSAATISSTGMLTVSNQYSGIQSKTTSAVITTQVEKKTFGFFWKNVSNGEWTDTIYNFRYAGSHTLQLPSSGTYRITVVYTIYGSGGAADVIECEIIKSY